MTQDKWHTERTEGGVTVSRALPARFDVSARAEFPLVARARLAHQIRQDMWRALQNVRGFSPVVEVTQSETGLSVTAGGRAAAPISSRVSEQIEALLHNRANRQRWIACARKDAA